MAQDANDMLAMMFESPGAMKGDSEPEEAEEEIELQEKYLENEKISVNPAMPVEFGAILQFFNSRLTKFSNELFTVDPLEALDDYCNMKTSEIPFPELSKMIRMSDKMTGGLKKYFSDAMERAKANGKAICGAELDNLVESIIRAFKKPSTKGFALFP